MTSNTATRGRHDRASKVREKACVGINETTQLLSSVPDVGKCRDKGVNEGVFNFYSIAIARSVVRLAMPSRQQENRWKIGEDVLRMTDAVGGAASCILQLPEGGSPPNFEDQEPDQRERNEWFTQDRDAGSANDHHTKVQRQMREKHRTGERDMNPTSEKRTRQDSFGSWNCPREARRIIQTRQGRLKKAAT